ncbi:tRNA wybutosine-synthesizing protein 2 homolog [Varanus komodoensis]|uniref:tRNA wybutosine-synthesizing protein 2 homolog n=1 Tax=Varanus komodoensis TaxID=61221 RepID=UPI001CF78594|nr:tRNA wybutosine-synthesizing protein 2 homolog [Varanus komodoensis]XP_044283189.1 tRNA wybutosine-synthesizing protein 2 homolog [Varanus komodoensis]XP_044283191.1 tRNA wybutosine-synthesizing protein 2 homolog [Varanus komodoensis]
MDAEELCSCGTAALITEPQFTQLFRKCLQREGILDRRYNVQKLPNGTMALPVLGRSLTAQRLQQLKESIPPGRTCALTWIQNPIPSKVTRIQLPHQKLWNEVQNLMKIHGIPWSEELERDLPCSWQRHGDLILLSEDSFRATLWGKLGQELWKVVASALGARRLAKRGRVQSDLFRSPTVTLLLGQDGWVEHVDNGIRYMFDVTQCMLSPGNITEKLRIASLQCAEEVVVDLYAGIGYFTLPYLVHAGAAFVHACEWNPHAAEALRKNLQLNGVADRCQVHQGDNKKLELRDVADRVNLGLIPSSEEGWPVACWVLRKDVGGILHIHQNVESFPAKAPNSRQKPEQVQPHEHGLGQTAYSTQEARVAHEAHPVLQDAGKKEPTRAARCAWQRWAEATRTRIRTLLEELDGKPWRTQILHIERVKSYAPHVHHLVLDLKCQPAAQHTEESVSAAGVALEGGFTLGQETSEQTILGANSRVQSLSQNGTLGPSAQ